MSSALCQFYTSADWIRFDEESWVSVEEGTALISGLFGLSCYLVFVRGPDQVKDLLEELEGYAEFGRNTRVFSSAFCEGDGKSGSIPCFVNEFWTSRQRAAHSIQEISYRACFKPQVPRFFIERLTRPGEVVLDPFMGRGTAPIEAALLGREPHGCDLNPLSLVLTRPRLRPPTLRQVEARLRAIDFDRFVLVPESLSVFFHAGTLQEICALRDYLLERAHEGSLDEVDDFIRLVALNRLTGHSSGFFSVYTLPPNQATSINAQMRINAKRSQQPPRRVVPELILKKSRSLLRGFLRDPGSLETLARWGARSRLETAGAADLATWEDGAVQLIVTSPPFLDTVDYAGDNWLRGWFCGIATKSLRLSIFRKLEMWLDFVEGCFLRFRGVLAPGGFLAFEVGEIRKGTIRLDEEVLKVGTKVGLRPVCVVINDQEFTKTAHCWGVDNRSKGTNTNRVVVFENL